MKGSETVNRLAIDRQPCSVPRALSAVVRCAVVLAVLAAVLLPTPAHAQTVTYGTRTYGGTSMCVYGWTQLIGWGAFGLPLGFTATTEMVVWKEFSSDPPCQNFAATALPSCLGDAGPYACKPPWPATTWGPNDPYKHMDVGSIAVAQALYLDVNGSKQYCSTMVEWQYNSVGEAEMTAVNNASPTCGPGTYGVSTGVYVWDGTQWQGSWFWTGDLFLI